MGASQTYERPFVSIVISNYNDKDHLIECLNSLRKQTYTNFEVIVVDGASTDGSPEMIKREFPEYTLLNAGKIGPIKANNVGLLTSKGDYVVLDLNSDDVVSSTWLENLVNIMESDLKIGVAGGKRYTYGTDIIESEGATVNFLTGETPPINRGRRMNTDLHLLREVDYVPVMMVRRDIIRHVGLLDETYVFYFEEPDFCLRVKRAGYKVVCVPSAVHWHHGSASIGKFSLKRYYFLRRNQIRFVIKNFPLHCILICILWLLIGKTLLDSLSSMPIIQRVIKLFRPNSFRANFDRRIMLTQLEAIKWNFLRIKETINARRLHKEW